MITGLLLLKRSGKLYLRLSRSKHADIYSSMRSFWAENSCCPTWTGLLTSWLTSHPPMLLDAYPPPFPLHPIAGCTFGKATPEDISQLPLFWERWFSTPTSRCCIPQERIHRSHSAGHWDIFVVRRGNQVIGSLVRRWVTGFHVKEAYLPKAGVIDLFCVHPAWKKKGVGRALLCLVHTLTARPAPPHLMLWESYLPSIPPMAAGVYWRKEYKVEPREQISDAEALVAWNRLKEGRPIWSDYKKSEDVHIYRVNSGYVVIWNTWHRRIPQGDTIGIVLASTGSLDGFSSPFGLLLADTKYEGWEFNGPFQWGLYNMNTGFISSQFPLLHWL
jgi:hypothetical protein